MAELYGYINGQHYTDHPQVEALSPAGLIACDVLMKPLLEQVWLAGLNTQFSCQGDKPESLKPSLADQAYVLLLANEKSDKFIETIIEDIEGFKNGYNFISTRSNNLKQYMSWRKRKYFGIEYEPRVDEYGNRVCLRFPAYFIPDFTDYVGSLSI